MSRNAGQPPAEQQALPYHPSPPPAGNALLFAPHPDDEVFGCAGAMLAHRERGDPVDIVVVTDGAQQEPEPGRRRRESEAAAALLGCPAPEFWDLPDRSLSYGEPLVERILETISNSGAQVIYAPSPWEVHPDHLALAQCCIEAVRRLQPQPAGEVTLMLYEVGVPLLPNQLLDLTPYRALKRQAMSCFESQLVHQRYDQQVDGLNRFRAYTLGPTVEAAEAYLAVGAAELRDGRLPGLFDSPAQRRAGQGLRVDDADAALVSVICRTVGRPEFEQTQRSVALQTYPAIELIVVDAAAAGLVLEPWCGRFPQRAVASAVPLARAAAGNAGLDAATGRWCLFLDDDDWIEPDHVHKLVSALESSRAHRVAHTGIRVTTPDGTPSEPVYDAPHDPLRLLTDNYLPIHAVLFERSLVEAGCRLDETLDYFEDWDLWLQLGQHSRFLHVPGISGWYRAGGNSGTSAELDPNEPDTAAHYRRGQLAVLGRYLSRNGAEALLPLLRDGPDSVRELLPLRGRQAQLDQRLQALEQELEQTLHDGRAAALDLETRLQKVEHAHEQALSDGRAATLQLESRLQELGHVYASTSWRLTAPYRWLVGQLNRIGIH